MKKYLTLFALALALCCGCENKKSDSGQGSDVEEPANIKYGTYIIDEDYSRFVKEEISINVRAKQLEDDIKVLKEMDLDYSAKTRELKDLCGLNRDKEICYGYTDALIVTNSYVRMGSVGVYSNYSGKNAILDSGLSSDVAEVCGTERRGTDILQIVENGTKKYSYKASGTKITISNGTIFNYNSKKNQYIDADDEEIVYETCHFVQ